MEAGLKLPSIGKAPIGQATSRKIGTPIGTVIAMACDTEACSTPRRAVALLRAKVKAASSANRPPINCGQLLFSAPRPHWRAMGNVSSPRARDVVLGVEA